MVIKCALLIKQPVLWTGKLLILEQVGELQHQFPAVGNKNYFIVFKRLNRTPVQNPKEKTYFVRIESCTFQIIWFREDFRFIVMAKAAANQQLMNEGKNENTSDLELMFGLVVAEEANMLCNIFVENLGISHWSCLSVSKISHNPPDRFQWNSLMLKMFRSELNSIFNMLQRGVSLCSPPIHHLLSAGNRIR